LIRVVLKISSRWILFFVLRVLADPVFSQKQKQFKNIKPKPFSKGFQLISRSANITGQK